MKTLKEFIKHEFSYKCSADCALTLYDVINVPIGMATNAYSMEDTNYITHGSRLIPDWLHEKETNFLDAANYYKALWFELGEIDTAGEYTLTVDFKKIEKIVHDAGGIYGFIEYDEAYDM